MKGIPKSIFQKRIEYLVWVWIIILFLMMCHRKITEARSIYEGNGDPASLTIVQNTEGHSQGSCTHDKDQCNSKVFAYVQQSEESGQSGAPKRRKLFIASTSQVLAGDIYENDDQLWLAKPIVVNNPDQDHTFHNDTDIDWVYFFGHAEYEYDIKADDGTACEVNFIKVSLTDPNGVIVTDEGGNPIQEFDCYIHWECPRDGYYYIKVKLGSEGGLSYKLSVEDNQAASPASLLGRVINSKCDGKGVNGVQVNLWSSGQILGKAWTVGSLANVRDNTLDPSKIDGWFFIPIIASGVYELRVTMNDPNNPLKKISDVCLEPHKINRIEKDIILDLPPGKADVLSMFDLIYTQYQNMKQNDYPVWEDKDGDGASNLREFLAGSDPDDPSDIPLDMCLHNGWSMISIPLKHEGAFVSKLFPEAAAVYAYEKDLGYKRVQETEKLKVGMGYWMLSKVGKINTLTGEPITSYTLSVNEDGWQMIGGCTDEFKASADSCRIDVIYGYDQESGYHQINISDDLEPGKGYWILLNGIENQCNLTLEAN